MKSFKYGSIFYLFATLATLSACNPQCEAGSGTPGLILGTGDRIFEPMPDSMALINGPQGGYHLLIAFEAINVVGDQLATVQVTGTLNGETKAEQTPWLEMTCENNALYSTGITLIYDAEPADLTGQSTHITASFTDIEGNTAFAESTVLITAPDESAR